MNDFIIDGKPATDEQIWEQGCCSLDMAIACFMHLNTDESMIMTQLCDSAMHFANAFQKDNLKLLPFYNLEIENEG